MTGTPAATEIPRRVLIIGSGLIGTSIALALRERGTEVMLNDLDAAAARMAADLGAGTVVRDLNNAKGVADIAVIAVPPDDVAATLALAQHFGVAGWYTDVASVKRLPVRRARELGCDLATYVPGHPMAGREKQGPAAGRADLFRGRIWALLPLEETDPAAVEAVSALALACGAELMHAEPETHDQWVALCSHAPHLVASAMAAQLAPALVPKEALRLSGQGLRDVTRIAAGDPDLWAQIVSANAGPVADVIAAIASDLEQVATSLAEAAVYQVRESGSGDGSMQRLLRLGQSGEARIPGKHGSTPGSFRVVQVVIADQPGELGRLFAAVGAAGINVEDVHIEHSPGLPSGVVEVAVPPEQGRELINTLQAGGWSVRG